MLYRVIGLKSPIFRTLLSVFPFNALYRDDPFRISEKT